jgi:hypothetical protein
MQIAAGGVTPSRHVGFIGVRNAQGQTVQKNIAALGQMENIIMAVMYEPSRVDWLVVPALHRLFAVGTLGNRDRLDPVKSILKHEYPSIYDGTDDRVRQKRTRGARAEIQEKRAGSAERLAHNPRPEERPVKIVFQAQSVLISAILNPLDCKEAR